MVCECFILADACSPIIFKVAMAIKGVKHNSKILDLDENVYKCQNTLSFAPEY